MGKINSILSQLAVKAIKGSAYVRKDGLVTTYKRVKTQRSKDLPFEMIARKPLYSEQELRAQRESAFPRRPTISLLLFVQRATEEQLRQTVRSLLAQSYGQWELCLCTDGSRSFRCGDRRVRMVKGDGINAAFAASTGEYIAFLGEGDLLHPAALHDIVKALCETEAELLYTDEVSFTNQIADAAAPLLKPAYAPDSLLSRDFMGSLTVCARSLFVRVGGFRDACAGARLRDFHLRAADAAGSIAHLPELLYYRRAGLHSEDAEAGRRAVAEFLRSKGYEATVETLPEDPLSCRISYALEDRPLISILIPNCEQQEALTRCIDSIYEKTVYPNFELVIVENNSHSPELFRYYEELQKTHENCRVAVWDKPFNYSAVNNFGAQLCRGEYILLLNNDTEVLSPHWLEEMLMFAQRADVGVVGAKLLYPNGRIQHGGVLLGAWGLADHYFIGEEDGNGVMGRLRYVQDLSAVTGACLLIRRSLYMHLGGMNEELTICFNDVDLCLKAKKAGYQVVWTPFARLCHYESLSRASDETVQKRGRLNKEIFTVRDRWGDVLREGDMSFNPNYKLKTPFAVASVLRPHPARCVRKSGGLLPERSRI